MKLLSISNYENRTLYIYDVPNDFETSEDYEEHITEVLGYRLSNIEWFIFDEIVHNEGSK